MNPGQLLVYLGYGFWIGAVCLVLIGAGTYVALPLIKKYFPE